MLKFCQYQSKGRNLIYYFMILLCQFDKNWQRSIFFGLFLIHFPPVELKEFFIASTI